jgi:hypothetical protein
MEGVDTTIGLDGKSQIRMLDEDDCSTFLDAVSIGNGSENNGATIPSEPVCIPATTLHTKTCTKTSDGCFVKIGTGNVITYGTIPNGTPKAGDAYDCKVKANGDYTERFYYVQSYGDNSILIYYKNMNGQSTYAYDSNNQNWHGPRTAYRYMPSISDWDNPLIIAPGTRQIVTDNNRTETNGGTIEPFEYTDKAARFLTLKELETGCGRSVGRSLHGDIDGCIWLMENIGYFEKDSGSYGYWLETPRFANTDMVFYVDGLYRYVFYNFFRPNFSTRYGVRPVITVSTSNISN